MTIIKNVEETTGRQKERKQKNWRSKERETIQPPKLGQPLVFMSQDEKPSVTLRETEPGEKSGGMEKISTLTLDPTFTL